MKTDDYQQALFDKEWFASSPCLEIGNDVLPDNIAYYIEGDEYIASRLKIVVNFNNKTTGEVTLNLFAEIAAELFSKALGKKISEELHTQIISEGPFNTTVDNKNVEMLKEVWPTGLGHTLEIIININTSAATS